MGGIYMESKTLNHYIMKSTQYQLQKRVQNTGVNIVTCPNCGSVVLHEASLEQIECHSCGIVSEPSDFPDLFHEELSNDRSQSLSQFTSYTSIIPSELSQYQLRSMCGELQTAKNHNLEFITINLNGVKYNNPTSRLKDYQELCKPMTGGIKT